MNIPSLFSINDWLTCANCGEDYLHQFGVQVFSNNGTKAIYTNYDCGDGMIDIPPGFRRPGDETKPAGWDRQGLRILFVCEHCDSVTALSVFQHKGNTHIERTLWDDWNFAGGKAAYEAFCDKADGQAFENEFAGFYGIVPTKSDRTPFHKLLQEEQEAWADIATASALASKGERQ